MGKGVREGIIHIDVKQEDTSKNYVGFDYAVQGTKRFSCCDTAGFHSDASYQSSSKIAKVSPSELCRGII